MMKLAEILSKWNSIIINNIAYQYLIREDYEIAIEKLEFLLRIDPNSLIAYWNLSNACRINGNYKRAYELQNKLFELLEDKDVTSLRRNHGEWFFDTEFDKGALFCDLEEKKCYSYYSMALTCYLIDSKKEAQEYIDKAQKLGSCDKTSTMDFLNFNIICLQKRDRNLINKIDEFRDFLIYSGCSHRTPKTCKN